MNTKSSSAGVIHPQSPDIPKPLEIHPSVDPELARGLINAVEYINSHLEEFAITSPRFGPKVLSLLGREDQGCVICHAERLSNWKRPDNYFVCTGIEVLNTPLGNWERIFNYHNGRPAETPHDWFETHAGRIARVEHFLRTGL